MAFMKKCGHVFRSIFGWLLIVSGVLSGVSGSICAVAALFGGLELDSLGERLGFFVMFLMYTAGSFAILWLGIRLKNGDRRNRTGTERKSPPVSQPVADTKPPVPKASSASVSSNGKSTMSATEEATVVSFVGLNIKKIRDSKLGTLRLKTYESDTDVDVHAFVNGLYETNFKPVKVRLIEGVERDMQSVDGDAYLISTFLEDYEEIKTMGHDLMYRVYGYLGNDQVIITIADDYRIITTSAENPDIELEDILKKVSEESAVVKHHDKENEESKYVGEKTLLNAQKKEEIMKQGEHVYAVYARCQGFTYSNRKFADNSSTLPPAYILVEERFTTGHDDSAEFVELIDENENIITSWKFAGPLKKCFENPDFWEDDCLVYYLKETLKLKVVQNTWGRNVGAL